MSLVCFDPSVVAVEKTFIVNQIVSCPINLSQLVLLDSVNESFVPCLTVNYDSVTFALS